MLQNRHHRNRKVRMIGNHKRLRLFAAGIVFLGGASIASAAPVTEFRPCTYQEWYDAAVDIHNSCVDQNYECGDITSYAASEGGSVIAFGQDTPALERRNDAPFAATAAKSGPLSRFIIDSVRAHSSFRSGLRTNRAQTPRALAAIASATIGSSARDTIVRIRNAIGRTLESERQLNGARLMYDVLNAWSADSPQQFRERMARLPISIVRTSVNALAGESVRHDYSVNGKHTLSVFTRSIDSSDPPK
jgi:hypothetical protein